MHGTLDTRSPAQRAMDGVLAAMTARLETPEYREWRRRRQQREHEAQERARRDALSDARAAGALFAIGMDMVGGHAR